MTTREKAQTPALSRTARLLRGLRRDPEQLIILFAAATVAVLGATDSVNDAKTLLAATLATLAILGFSLFKQAMRQEVNDQRVVELARSMDAVKNGIDEVETTLTTNSTMGELTTRAAKQKAFETAMITADMWQFRGGTGSFTRAWTLPALAARARESSTGTHWRVQLQILDPQNLTRCREYAEYRAKLSRRPGTTGEPTWTTEHVQTSCLATIFAAHWHQQHEFLVVEIRLRSEFSTLRHDISPESIIITNEDSHFPALHIRRLDDASALYHAYRADFDLSFASLEPGLKARSDIRVPADKDQVTDDDVFRVLRDVGIAEQTFHGLSLTSVRELALRSSSPYH
ncbi:MULTISPECIES: hypothetical protein [unclassified Amycolatopsis]|uniref:hypothetical protein n=1 Tax=unclassified Amycolatopsis TaxID=2618356 RepID=UPI002875413E|nr:MULTISPECIES: hypothetical protein [unclassified Amycolatopsis]MDS0136323.1 hypothetical protein [Amycolatopsis sp. 505]MDS0145838.1 hypothetical protein [Amycolatopsis sp. CM201R]